MKRARTPSLAPPALLCLSTYSWLILLVVLVFLAPQISCAASISLGSIHIEPSAEVKKFWPLASYLAEQLESEGIDQGKVVIAKSVPHMAALLQQGEVDLYIDSPFTSVAVSRLSGSKLLLRRWKHKVSEYHAVIFVRKDSDISQLEDLKGKLIAFEEPFSSSGYLLPKMVLMQEGLKLAPKMEATDFVGHDEIGYVFSQADENTVMWVLRGKVTGGAIDDDRFLDKARGHLDDLKIIYETFSIPRQIVSYRAGLPPNLVARIKQILIKMDQSKKGRGILKDFEKTTKFDEIPDQAMVPLWKSMKFIEAEVRLQ